MQRLVFPLLLILSLSLILLACGQVEEIEYRLIVKIHGQGEVAPAVDFFKKASTITFDIQPARGWEFSHWAGKNLNDLRNLDGEWYLFMDSDKELLAYFKELAKKEEYELVVVIEGEGSVEPQSGLFPVGQLLSFSLLAQDAWYFSHWAGTDACDVQEIDGQWQILMDADKELRAVFAQKEEEKRYQLMIEIEGEGSVLCTPLEEYYAPSTRVDLLARPAPAWYFKEWQGDLEGKEEKMTLEIDNHKRVKAVFLPLTHSLEIKILGQGQVKKELIKQEEKEYPSGSLLQLEALPASGWYFLEWRGDLTSSDAQEYIILDADKEVTAVFSEQEPNYYPLNLSSTPGGSIKASPDLEEYREGTLVSLTARSDEGWYFHEWLGDLTGSSSQLVCKMDSPKTIMAIFREDQGLYPLHITSQGQGLVERKPNLEYYPKDSLVILTAQAQEGWLFKEWRGASTGKDAVLELMISGPTEITAIFIEEASYYKLELLEARGCLVTIEPKLEQYKEGSLVKLRAYPYPKHMFPRWIINGRASVSGTEITITMDEDKQITLISDLHHSLIVETKGHGSVTSFPDQEYHRDGAYVSLIAEADPGWEFFYWAGDLGYQLPCPPHPSSLRLGMKKDERLQAIFIKEKQYGLHIVCEGEGFVLKEPDLPSYEHGTLVELTAQAAPGWKFLSWEGEVEAQGKKASLKMEAHKEIKVLFVPEHLNYYQLHLGESPGLERISCYPMENYYEEGTLVTIQAYPLEGWDFSHWEGTYEDSRAKLEFIIQEDIYLTPRFTELEACLLEIEIIGQGDVLVSPYKKIYYQGNRIDFTALADKGWEFRYWEGPLEDTNNSYSWLTITEDTKITAVFAQREEKERYTLDTYVLGPGQIQVEPEAEFYEEGTSVELRALADPACEFLSWEMDIKGTEPLYQLVMDKDKKVMAVFAPVGPFKIIRRTIGEGEILLLPDLPEYEHCSRVEVQALPALGARFLRWSGDLWGSQANTSLVVNEPKEIVAEFIPINDNYFILEVQVLPGSLGTVRISPDQSYYEGGTPVTLTAISERQYFQGWTLDGVHYDEPVLELTIYKDTFVEAHFTRMDMEE